MRIDGDELSNKERREQEEAERKEREERPTITRLWEEYEAQKLLTHKSPQMTQRYAHLHDEALKKAANVAEDIITDVMKDDEEKGKVIPFADNR